MHVLANKPRLPRIQHLLTDSKINDPFLEGLMESQADALLKF
jgi:hypothetical protein